MGIQNQPARLILQISCLAVLLLLLAGAVSIPFVYPSQSILYKFGTDRALLRIGKIFGLLAAVFFLLQLPLVSRLSGVEKIFGQKSLHGFHKINAMSVSLLALLHPIIVFAPEEISTMPFELRYWPEFIGLFLLLLILLTFVSSRWMVQIHLSRARWLRLHKAATTAAVFALAVHVLSVSYSFKSGLPRTAFVILIGLYFLLWARRRGKS